MSGTALKRVLVIFFVFYTIQFHASAQGKNFFISKKNPSWIVNIGTDNSPKQPKDISDGYFLSLFEDQNQVELHENYRHLRREIVTDAGVQNGSEISVTYDPSFQQLIFHSITVWRNGHPYDKLDRSKFKVLQNEKDLSKFIYSGTFDAYLILDDIRKGDRIEYSFTLKGLNPIFGNKYADEFYFENSKSASHRYSNVIVSEKRKLNFKNFNFNKEPKVSERNGLKVYEWENKNTKTYRTTDYEPSWYNPFKHTQVSEYQTWNEVVNWGLQVNNYPNLNTPLVDKKVKELQLKAKGDQKKYMELAIRFVQDEVRYMGIEMGQYSQRPNSPEKVLQQRYGDCKDKSLLLVFMLNRANIQAYMAYIDTYSGRFLKDILPTPFAFDHAVVVIEYANQKKWIDATISYQRGNFDQIYFPNYGMGLVLKPGVTGPENVISKPTGKLTAKLEFFVADTSGKDKTRLIINSTYTGKNADGIRNTIAEDGVDDLEKSFLEYISSYYPNTESNGDIKINDNEQTNTIKITETYLIPELWTKKKKKNSRFYTYFYADLIDHSVREISAKNRIQPLALKYPENIDQNITVHLPEGWDGKDESFDLKTDNYHFKSDISLKGKVLSLHYSYLALKDHVDTKDIPQYIKDNDNIQEHLSFGIYWGGNAEKPVEYNSYLILFAVSVFVLSGFLFFKIFTRTSPFDIEKMADAKRVGGWLIFLGLGLTGAPIKLLLNLYESNLFLQSSWNAFGNENALMIYLTRAGYTLETFLYMIHLTALFLLLALFYSRRMEFVKLYPAYCILNISIMIFDHLFGFFITSSTQPSLDKMAIVSQLAPDAGRSIYAIFISIVWILYLRKSERVKETFVFTYPKASWTNQLNLFKNERLATYYKNINVSEQSNGNNDYLSSINLKKDNNNTTENEQAQDPALTAGTKSADDNKKSNNEDL